MITTTLEALLFASAKPVSVASLKKALGVSDETLSEALDDVKTRFNRDTSGIHLVEADGDVQFVTNPACAEALAAFLKVEASGELTRPSLETLTIIAYRGPITKPEIEQIRGVNCSLILRNLMIRGLVEAEEDKRRLMTYYRVTTDFLRFLGFTRVTELPDYDTLHSPEVVERL